MTIPRLTREEVAILSAAAEVASRHDAYRIEWCRPGGSSAGWTLFGLYGIDEPTRSHDSCGYVDFDGYTVHGQLTSKATVAALEAKLARLRGDS